MSYKKTLLAVGPSIFAFPALIVLAAAVAAPLGNGLLGYPSGERFYAFLSDICHQFPTRSFWLFDHPLAICARCTGGYLGITAGVLAVMLTKGPTGRNHLAMGAALFVAAVLEAYIGLSDGNIWRAISGFVGGYGLMLLIRSASAVLFLKLRLIPNH
jgi:uncharacterized membrane protein